jgi:hypothetical protein
LRRHASRRVAPIVPTAGASVSPPLPTRPTAPPPLLHRRSPNPRRSQKPARLVFLRG